MGQGVEHAMAYVVLASPTLTTDAFHSGPAAVRTSRVSRPAAYAELGKVAGTGGALSVGRNAVLILEAKPARRTGARPASGRIVCIPREVVELESEVVGHCAAAAGKQAVLYHVSARWYGTSAPR